MALSIHQRFSDIETQIDGVAAAIKQDASASPALRAVVEELHTKIRDARDETAGAGELAIRDHIVEAEEAADAAKHAAEAETGLADGTRRAIAQVHDALAALKRELPA